MPIVLTINAGSSSIKYQCFEMVDEICLAKGQIDRLNSSKPELTYHRHDGTNYQLELTAQPYQIWFPLICATLTSPQHGIIDNLEYNSTTSKAIVNTSIHPD